MKITRGEEWFKRIWEVDISLDIGKVLWYNGDQYKGPVKILWFDQDALCYMVKTPLHDQMPIVNLKCFKEI